jgi:hypothetical protein
VDGDHGEVLAVHVDHCELITLIRFDSWLGPVPTGTVVSTVCVNGHAHADLWSRVHRLLGWRQRQDGGGRHSGVRRALLASRCGNNQQDRNRGDEPAAVAAEVAASGGVGLAAPSATRALDELVAIGSSLGGGLPPLTPAAA